MRATSLRQPYAYLRGFVRACWLGLQPDPRRRQVPKTQAPLRVFVIAGSPRHPCLSPPPRGPSLGHPARPRLSSRPALPFACLLKDGPRCPYPDDRYPVAPYPFFAGYLFRYTRRQICAWPSLRGSAMLDGTDGYPWTRVAVRVREMELGLWPLGGRVPPERLAAPEGPPAGQAGSVRRAAGQHDRARGGRAQKARGGSRAGPQSGRLRHPDPHPGGCPLRLRVTGGPGPSGSLDRRAPALPDRGPGL